MPFNIERQLGEFNRNIVGKIEVIAEFRPETLKNEWKLDEGLRP
jgi:hypothetical protein